MFELTGEVRRNSYKSHVMNLMKNLPECQPDGQGKTSASIFKECSFNWGKRKKAASSSQQCWVMALLRVLEEEGKIVHLTESERWRLKA
ncbi:MAG: hypothetical protein RQ982_11810 [Gammaproteobacteria bacterium]|nr:hypothetical protein [Gammaproteobacteria bacterium]